jgi:hypothetical protein
MNHTLGGWFDHPSKYAYTHANAASDDECMICKEPYGNDGCTAIRLTECGHVIGFSCFRQWLQRQPDACPYWNHKLGRSGNMSLLERVCKTVWFEYMELSVLERDDSGLLTPSLRVLHEGRLGLVDAKTLLLEYSVPHLWVGPTLGAILGIIFLCLFATYLGLGCVWLMFMHGTFGLPALWHIGVVLTVIESAIALLIVLGTVNTIAFAAPVLAVLVLALCRAR